MVSGLTLITKTLPPQAATMVQIWAASATEENCNDLLQSMRQFCDYAQYGTAPAPSAETAAA